MAGPIQLLDAVAPPVVAVLVTRDPGPWLEETLAALAAQDYADLSVLVLVSGGSEDPTARVAGLLPGAFIRRLDEDRGFGAGADEVIGMVEGAAFLLLCHDDCAPATDALHILVEESYRSNAAVVGPKMLRWDDPRVLLHVGMSADKTGAAVERIQPGEVDHGQHDGVRDVFFVPGGCTLVRADLFDELDGFDRSMLAMGEDLEFCWRAHVAGARVVVAPDATARHLEALAGGARRLTPPAGEDAAPSLHTLQRRHELRAVLTCYGFWHLLRVLPQAAALAAGEVLVALFGGDRARARTVTRAWTYNLSHLAGIRRARAQIRAHRRVPDGEVRVLQWRGSARLSTYLSRLTHQGFDVAQARVPSLEAGLAIAAAGSEEPVLTGSVGLAFSEDADFDELDDLGHRAGRDRHGRRRRARLFSTVQSRLLGWLVVVVVLVIGSRDLIGGNLPLIGQFVPLLGWSSTWHHFVAGWQPAGVGTTAPATPAFAFLGAVGTVLLGGMGLTQKVLVLGCVPLGAWGLARFLRPWASARARLAGAVAYLGLALVYDALAQGRWDGMVAFAATPWIMSRLARATGLSPFARRAEDGAPAGRWRATLPGQMVTLGVVVAVAVAFAPGVAPVTVLCGLGILVGSWLVGQWRGAARALAVALGATAVAAVLLGPWVIGTLLAGHGAVGVFGLTGGPWSAPSFGGVVRFDLGPTGGSPLSWLLVIAALLPLVVGRHDRLAWAGRLWTVAVMSWLLVWADGRGWTAPFSPSLVVVLAPAAVAVAAGVGLGVVAFERDLAEYRFGWRQAVSAVAIAAAAVGLLPVLAAAGDGRWGLPVTGYGSSLSFLSNTGDQGAFRVLWIGAPRALPLGAWSLEPGVAYATSEDGTADAVDLWAPAGPGPTSTLADAVALATEGATDHLGQLLAPAGVRYVVVVEFPGPERGRAAAVGDLSPAHRHRGRPVRSERPAGRPRRRQQFRGVREPPLRAGTGDPGRAQDGGDGPRPRPGHPERRRPFGVRRERLVAGAARAARAGPLHRAGSRRHGVRLLRPGRALGAQRERGDGVAPVGLRLGVAIRQRLGRDRRAGLRRHTPRPARRHPRGPPLAGAPGRPARPPSVPRLVVAAGASGRPAVRQRRSGVGCTDARRRPPRPGGRRGGIGRLVRGRAGSRAGPVGSGAVRAVADRAIWRLPVIAVVAAVFVAAVLVDHHVAVSTVPQAPDPALALAGPTTAESTTWYCVGGTAPADGAPATIYLVNAGPLAVSGTMTVESDTGATGSVAVTVPALGQAVAVPASVASGSWLAARLDLSGGGVVATESVQGSSGWSVSPCASTTSPSWYFATGSTAGSNAQYLSLFNPTGTSAVVDMTFVTSHGVTQPAPFQGVVLNPGQLVVEPVATYVQNDQAVATTVVARSGRVVAAQLGVVTGGSQSGLSLLGGSIGLRRGWAFPRSADVTGGNTSFQIFNPAGRGQRVTVAVRLDSGLVHPFVQTVGADSVWTMSASAASRIPAGADFSTEVTSTGGPGVVVTRVAVAPPASVPPQLGAVAGAVVSPDAATSARTWLLAAVGTSAAPATMGAAPLALDIANPDPTLAVAVTVEALSAKGPMPLSGVPTMSIPPGHFVVIDGQLLAAVASTDPLLVRATGPVTSMEDLVPAGMAGVVSQVAVPVAG